jgi:aspartate ammonia-lyase
VLHEQDMGGSAFTANARGSLKQCFSSPHDLTVSDLAGERAALIVHVAARTDSTVREAARRSGYVSAEDLDRIVDPREMTGLRPAAT